MYKKTLAATLLALAAYSSQAAGPSSVAIGDRATWPIAINSVDSFDQASRAELLAFGHELAASERLSDDELQKRLKVKPLDHASVERVRAKFWRRLFANYAVASSHCDDSAPFCAKATTQAEFTRLAKSFDVLADSPYQRWWTQAQRFHKTYLNELLRLAALFPRVNSEIDTFSEREIDGSELPDRTFLLTFDDGPTSSNGTTDQLLGALHQAHVNAVFFTLGPQLQARLQRNGMQAVRETYHGMCVGAHGWEHRSHSTWADWQDSVTRSIGLVRTNLPDSFVPLFRPPYGQRKAASGEWFASQGLRVALWNIDSQDWNEKVSADDVRQRVYTLVLLWRHGIVLFHDIHSKAQLAVPWLHEQFGATGVRWMDCKQLSVPGLR